MGHGLSSEMGALEGVERLNNLEQLPAPTGYTLAVFPARIERASAGWTRAVAIVPARARPRGAAKRPGARRARGVAKGQAPKPAAR